MNIQTAIHIQPGSHGGPRIEKAATTGRTQPAAPVASPENTGRTGKNEETAGSLTGLSKLTPSQLRMVSELKTRDQEVRTHEQAHISAGGGHVNGGIRYIYQKGPDGKMYAIGGEVSIDVSPIPGDPEATARKMEQVRRAAMAPSDPSPQDRSVAARATMIRSAALQDLALIQLQQQKDKTANTRSNSKAAYENPEPLSGQLIRVQA
ncbi:putative metalloprotease CJM1_0395 family protein [Desulfobotulus sp. H1]|uniref:Metalloprotease CJM1_0395 family protein n=1 Tax=Desulfobotulus pelophilus TaxID=2823377 RepID=A0ABT3NB88_9BACT|nr:putative metalloprotease CJM1_0395 family protein [Desulfobotulus pelophilus]MCW7754719.1 putative metalloprotease CJM1_0395 family protein [Desulfobotulus pelophilus]